MAFDGVALRKRRAGISLLLGLGITLCALEARAEVTPAERESARTAMQAGDQLRGAGDRRGALQQYKSAHAIMHVPTTGLAVAQMEVALGWLLEARSTAIEVINLPGEGNESKVFANARAAAEQLAARLQPLIPALVVEVVPEGVRYTVTIDGVEVSEAALELPLKANPGVHTVEVKARGYVAQAREIQLVESEPSALRLYFVLEALAAASGPPPSATEVPVTPPDLGVSAHANTSTAPARAQAVDPVAAAKTRAIVGLSLGGALLLGGAAAGIASAIKTTRLRDRCDDGYCGEARLGALSTANTLANIANIAIPVGALMIGYALYELLTAHDAEADDDDGIKLHWRDPQIVEVRW
jgi:hypothetical protein